jgi:hypothetical protein
MECDAVFNNLWCSVYKVYANVCQPTLFVTYSSCPAQQLITDHTIATAITPKTGMKHKQATPNSRMAEHYKLAVC